MMTITDFIESAKLYDELGWAVQAQLDDLLDNTYLEPGDLNDNAVRMIAKFADELYDIDTTELHAAIERYESLEHDDEDFDDGPDTQWAFERSLDTVND